MPSESYELVLMALKEFGGTVENSSGFATRSLVEATGLYNAQVNQILKQLEKEGLISRKVQGKRTYVISLIHSPALAKVVPISPKGLDLSELADSILRRCAELLEGPEVARVDAERLSGALDEAQRLRGRLRGAESELEGIRNERDALRKRIRGLEADKRTLEANLEQALRSGGRIHDEQVREGIARFMQERPTRYSS